MEEVRQLVQEEGREARNLVAFHVAVDTPARVARKPPRTSAPPQRRAPPRPAVRLRSASAGRDKRSELRARYWALLFGDLQRAVGEIYNTVEAHENQNECQEVILVLENYTRDFKALGEWFRLKWEYDNTPPPQRPQSLAWEIRKTDFVRPESRRTHSVRSSPSVSGKNSPCLSGHNTPSGKNSPNLTGKASPGSGKISPRISGHSSTSPKGNIEFFSNKIASKIATKPEPKVAKETRLSDIKEKDIVAINDGKKADKDVPKEKIDKEQNKPVVEIGKAKECPNVTPKPVVFKTPKRGKPATEDKKPAAAEMELSSQAKATIAKLDAIENEFLAKQLAENAAKNENMINQDIERDKITNSIAPKKLNEMSAVADSTDTDRAISESSVKPENNFGYLSNDNIKRSDEKSTTATISGKMKSANDINVSQSTEEKKSKSVTGKKKDATIYSAKKDSVSKIIKELYTKEVKLFEAKDMKTTVVANSNDKDRITPESLTKSEDNFGDMSNVSSKSSDGKSITTLKIEEPKLVNGIDAIQPAPENKAKAVTAKKKEATSTSAKRDTAFKVVIPSKEFKLSDVKDKKETNNKIIKAESVKKDDSQNYINENQKINWAEVCETEMNKNGNTGIVIQKDKKPESKSPEPNSIDAKDAKKDDKDPKKAESKPADARPTARPAYSQAAAKPKLVTAKDEVKTPTKTISRSKTVMEIRPNSAPNRQAKQFLNRNLKNKCSYPFNLTTGRISLFDAPTPHKAVAPKRPASRTQLASGDAKNLIKPDLKTRPPRPDSLKINEQGDKQEGIDPAFEKFKDCDAYSSSDTVVTQIDVSRIESSESLKTIVPDGLDVAASIEVLNVDGDKTDNEGWLTVKSRRLSRESKKSKSHWANRFHQPSATTSLPTLNIMESPKSESNPIVDSNLDRAKSEQPQNKPEKAKGAIKKEPKDKDTTMIRQKSDVTGLRTRSSRNKALKKDKNRDKKDSELTINRLHSSLESLTTGLARSQESTEEVAFDFDKWKVEFMTTFKYLEDDDQMTNHNEILKTADPSEMSEIAAMTSQIEENERKISLALDFQSEVDQRKLCQEEDLLNRQIMELQQVSDNDLDTETDDTETDAEIICDDSAMVPCKLGDNRICRDLASCLEHHYESALEGMSWSERIDMLGVLEDLVARDPGRAQQLHAKLSQGIKRRGSLQDVLRRLQAKQARAAKQRMQLHTERANKIHQLLARVEEVKMAKNQLIEEKRNRMERRLQKAAENRDQHLKDIVRKAHDEEEKLREIAFIKQLEAENRRHEFLEQCRSLTTRLREMRRERLDKLEQKAAREAAVGARRQALEAARKLHVESLLERRKERDARREELKEQKRQERDDAAREKAEGVKSRLSALAAAAELETVALRSRIRDKQDASQLRLESHLQAIREKATGPRVATTSECQDPTTAESKEQEEEVLRLEQERKEREKQKVLRKKARKLKQKILASSKEGQLVDNQTIQTFINPSISKMHRSVNQLSNLIAPLLNPDFKPITAFDLDGFRPRRSKMAEQPVENNKTDFKYDFEDKMGKKKKKKKAQEKAETQKNSPNQKGQTNDGQKNKNDVQKTSGSDAKKSQANDHDEKKISKQIEAQKTKGEAKNAQKEKNVLVNGIQEHHKINRENSTNQDDKQNDTHQNKGEIQQNGKETLQNGNDTHENASANHQNFNEAQYDNNEEQKTKTESKKSKSETQKKKNPLNETRRHSKSNSVCSSVSDMSKASYKCEKPVLMLDIPLVEKLIGELYRMTTSKDCNDNLKPKSKLPDITIFTKLHAVKTFGHLYSILAEREDLLSQLSLKALAMSVVTTCRIMVTCKPTALYFFSTAATVHTISLLNYQLSKDLSDPKELELAKQLADLVSVSLDSALCESRVRACEGDENVAMSAVRARAHSLISYLCLTGCIARAEHAGEARERVQTLVTLCADLCQPHKTDAGPERASAIQSLRCALGTGIMGSRAEFCMLFAEGAELSRSQNFVRAARTTHLLRQLAELDHMIVQDAFGEGGWPLEFRAAVARLLSQHAPNDKAAPSSDVLHLSNQRLDVNLSEQMVLDLIVLVGFVVVNNPQLQETICENWGVIKTLCTLPANWLVSEYHCHSLLPTLIVLADRPETAKVIFSELSMKMLENYMNSAEGRKMKLIQVLKAARDKAAKKEKQQGKKEKQQDVTEDINDTKDTNGDINHTFNGAACIDIVNEENVKVGLTNGDVKHDENGFENDSDTESIDEEV